MAKLRNLKEQEIKRLMGVYKCSREEAESMYEYDKEFCNSDEDAEEYLRDHLTTEYIEDKAINEIFYKSEKKKDVMTKAEIKVNTANATKDRTLRMDTLVEGLKKFDFLFGDLVERTNTELRYVDNETGLPITIKFSKHKVQKVVSKRVKKRTIQTADGKREELPFNSVELRAMAIGIIMRENTDIFEAPSEAGTQFGFACRDKKFPFGSIKMTHHKK